MIRVYIGSRFHKSADSVGDASRIVRALRRAGHDAWAYGIPVNVQIY